MKKIEFLRRDEQEKDGINKKRDIFPGDTLEAVTWTYNTGNETVSVLLKSFDLLIEEIKKIRFLNRGNEKDCIIRQENKEKRHFGRRNSKSCELDIYRQ